MNIAGDLVPGVMPGDSGKLALPVKEIFRCLSPEEAVGHNLIGHAVPCPAGCDEVTIIDRYKKTVIPVNHRKPAQPVSRRTIGMPFAIGHCFKAVPQQAGGRTDGNLCFIGDHPGLCFAAAKHGITCLLRRPGKQGDNAWVRRLADIDAKRQGGTRGKGT